MQPAQRFARRRRLLHGMSAVLVLATGTIARRVRAEQIVVIVNKDNTNVVDREFVTRVYTGAIRGWPDGTPVFALDQPEDSEARQLFTTTILGRSVANMRAIWSQNIFTGKGMPPKVTHADAQMKQLVAANRNAIGYIRASELDASVRALER